MKEIERKQIEKGDSQSACDALAQILDSMEDVASRCGDSLQKGIEYAESRDAGTALVTAIDRICALANEPTWRPLRPVIHSLCWHLRMLPQQDLATTFRAHAQVYASAARMMRNAIARTIAFAEPKDKTQQLHTKTVA